jgi:CheY-like chemotaxis protein
LTLPFGGAAIDCAEVGACRIGVRRKGNTVPRILVADDNTNIQKMVTLAFQERGVEVIAVGNGEAAVRRIPDANPDLVLADVFMPVRNGYEVCEFVKKDSRFAHTPVILLVGAFDPLDEKEARRVGADGVLKKPFVPPDPLIAMVMQALEKNPKVMAEWAKQKEAAAIAAAPPPLPALVNPVNAEPKPLPDFPEPTAEEAAVIYGFGKGVRGLDADEDEATERDAKAPATLKAETKGGLKPAEKDGPKTASGPSVNSAFDDEDEMAGMETATDRRRANTDFEVPENLSSEATESTDPIYSYGRDFEPITFPSEKDHPPKHVKETQEEAASAGEAAPAAKADVLEFKPATETTSSAVEAEAPVVAALEAKAEETSDWDIRPATEAAHSSASNGHSSAPVVEAFEQQAAVELVSGEVAHEEAPEPFSISSSSASSSSSSAPSVTPDPEALVFAPKALPERVFEAARDASEATAPWLSSPTGTPEPAAEHVAHTDVASSLPSLPSPDSTSAGGWMDMMTSSSSEGSQSHWMETISASAPATSTRAEETVNASSESAVDAVAHDTAAAEAERLATPQASSDWSHDLPGDLPAAAAIDLGEKFETEPRNFSQAGGGQFGSTSYHFNSGENANDHFSSSSSKEEAAAENAVVPGLEASPADLPATPVEQEAAPSEPQYVNEFTETAPQAVAQQEEQAPAEQATEPQAETAFAETLESREGLIESTPESLYVANETASADEDYTERMPTLPPTNREALSDIPFLMPHKHLNEVNAESNGSEPSNDMVDDVVRKVLEKLQPQLQQMLSQGMKPLLESLVQNELQKK